MKEVNFILNVYYNKNMSIDKKVETIGKHFFIHAKNKVSLEFKCAKAVSFFIEMGEPIFMPAFDVRESKYYNPDFIVRLQEKDYDLVNKCVAEANRRTKEYHEKRYIKNKYSEFFRIWSENNHPSHNKKGNWTHKEINEAQARINELKDKEPKLYDRIREYSIKFNCSVNLVCEVANQTLMLSPAEDGYYQFNLKNDDCIRIITEYCNKTNIEVYSDIYQKVSLLRSILNRLALYVFGKDYEVAKSGYYREKFHSRVLVNTREENQKVYSSNTINNYHIIFNNITKLLYNLVHYSKYNHNDNNITNNSYIDAVQRGVNDSS